MATDLNTKSINNSALRAFWVLRITFTIVPIIAGIDQFTDKLVNWDMYLAPLATRILPIPPHSIMMIAGAAEIIAGLIVAFAPRIGGWVVAIWLWSIIIDLLIAAGFYDNALRDFGLSLSAVALALLAAGFRRRQRGLTATPRPVTGAQ